MLFTYLVTVLVLAISFCLTKTHSFPNLYIWIQKLLLYGTKFFFLHYPKIDEVSICSAPANNKSSFNIYRNTNKLSTIEGFFFLSFFDILSNYKNVLLNYGDTQLYRAVCIFSITIIVYR